jgi:hypothetical protein
MDDMLLMQKRRKLEEGVARVCVCDFVKERERERERGRRKTTKTCVNPRFSSA